MTIYHVRTDHSHHGHYLDEAMASRASGGIPGSFVVAIPIDEGVGDASMAGALRGMAKKITALREGMLFTDETYGIDADEGAASEFISCLAHLELAAQHAKRAALATEGR